MEVLVLNKCIDQLMIDAEKHSAQLVHLEEEKFMKPKEAFENPNIFEFEDPYSKLKEIEK